jgi:hypothetical protein
MHIVYTDTAIVISDKHSESPTIIHMDDPEFIRLAELAIKRRDLVSALQSSSRFTQIRALRDMCGLGLRDAKNMLDALTVGIMARHNESSSYPTTTTKSQPKQSDTLGDILAKFTLQDKLMEKHHD